MHTIIFILILLFCSSYAGTVLAQDKQVIELPPIVVTASRVEEFISDVPASVSVVTPEDLKVKQITTLDDALRAVPGISIQTFGGADPSSSVSMRGTEDNHSIVMIDGVKINSPYFQRPHIGALLLNTYP